MPKLKRKNPNNELVQATKENIEKLRDYCVLFDLGKIHYGQDIAKVLCVLLLDEGKNNKSQFGLLGTKGKIRFNTLVADRKYFTPIGFGSYLVSMTLGNDVKVPFNANLNLGLHPNNKLGFKDWWKEKVAYEHLNGFDFRKKQKPNYILSRGELILYVRNQENGAHFDLDINSDLYKIKNNFPNLIDRSNGSLTFSFVKNSETNIKSKEFDDLFNQYPMFMLRAIAFEFLESIDEF